MRLFVAIHVVIVLAALCVGGCRQDSINPPPGSRGEVPSYPIPLTDLLKLQNGQPISPPARPYGEVASATPTASPARYTPAPTAKPLAVRPSPQPQPAAPPVKKPVDIDTRLVP